MDEALSALMAAVDARVPFGPAFFSTRLRAFVRDRCPDPSEALPIVEIALDTGEVIDVCGLAPLWLALAARAPAQFRETPMRTELVPYATIRRVSIRPVRPGATPMGFDREHRATWLPGAASSPEGTFDRAAGIHRTEPLRSDDGPEVGTSGNKG